MGRRMRASWDSAGSQHACSVPWDTAPRALGTSLLIEIPAEAAPLAGGARRAAVAGALGAPAPHRPPPSDQLDLTHGVRSTLLLC